MMSRSRRKRTRSLSEAARLNLSLARPKPNQLQRFQQFIRDNTQSVPVQIMEAETKAKVKSNNDKEGYLEKRGVAARRLKEELSERVEGRIVRDKHDKHADYIVLSRKGRDRLRQLRYFAMKRLASSYFENPREKVEWRTLNEHRSRVRRILDGHSPSVEIFDAAIPLFENLEKRALRRKVLAERILHLIQKNVKVPGALSKLDNVHATLVRDQKKYSILTKKYEKRVAWLRRMAGRVESGINVSSAAEHFIREMHDNLQDYNVTD